MINKDRLRNLIKEKNRIDEAGRILQIEANYWLAELKSCVGEAPFKKDGIDWCEIGLMLTEDSESHDRCVCNDRV